MLTKPALAVVNGRRREEAQLAHRARVRFPDEDEDRVALSYGGGEVLSAPSFAPTVRNVRTYLAVPRGGARGWRRSSRASRRRC